MITTELWILFLFLQGKSADNRKNSFYKDENRTQKNPSAAILKDAPILVLDEATANIDPDCEEHLQAAISALAKGKTLIVIAHRIRTIIHLNSILVISGGKVIAQETHSALLKDCPTYQSLFSAYKESENWALMTNRGVQC